MPTLFENLSALRISHPCVHERLSRLLAEDLTDDELAYEVAKAAACDPSLGPAFDFLEKRAFLPPTPIGPGLVLGDFRRPTVSPAPPPPAVAKPGPGYQPEVRGGWTNWGGVGLDKPSPVKPDALNWFGRAKRLPRGAEPIDRRYQMLGPTPAGYDVSSRPVHLAATKYAPGQASAPADVTFDPAAYAQQLRGETPPVGFAQAEQRRLLTDLGRYPYKGPLPVAVPGAGRTDIPDQDPEQLRQLILRQALARGERPPATPLEAEAWVGRHGMNHPAADPGYLARHGEEAGLVGDTTPLEVVATLGAAPLLRGTAARVASGAINRPTWLEGTAQTVGKPRPVMPNPVGPIGRMTGAPVHPAASPVPPATPATPPTWRDPIGKAREAFRQAFTFPWRESSQWRQPFLSEKWTKAPDFLKQPLGGVAGTARWAGTRGAQYGAGTLAANELEKVDPGLAGLVSLGALAPGGVGWFAAPAFGRAIDRPAGVTPGETNAYTHGAALASRLPGGVLGTYAAAPFLARGLGGGRTATDAARDARDASVAEQAIRDYVARLQQAMPQESIFLGEADPLAAIDGGLGTGVNGAVAPTAPQSTPQESIFLGEADPGAVIGDASAPQTAIPPAVSTAPDAVSQVQPVVDALDRRAERILQAAGGNPSPEQVAQLRQLAVVDRMAQRAPQVLEEIRQRHGLKDQAALGAALNDSGHAATRDVLLRLYRDPTLQKEFADLIPGFQPGQAMSLEQTNKAFGTAIGVWEAMPDSAKMWFAGGLSLAAIGILASLFSGGSDDEEDGKGGGGAGWAFPALAAAGLGAAGYGLSEGQGLGRLSENAQGLAGSIWPR